MKRIFALFICLFIYASTDAQITYTPYFRNSPNQGRPTQQSQKLRTTAYASSGQGYVKIPIIVTVTTYQYASGVEETSALVTSYYQDTGYGGTWMSTHASIQQCMSSFGGGLEAQFMYKALLSTLGWIYFDL